MTDAVGGAEPLLRPATTTDLAPVVCLINNAYRAPDSTGWCSETDYMTGSRIDEAALRAELASAGQLHVWESAGHIAGCVLLRPLGNARWLLGMLAIDPSRQNTGAGRQLLSAAEHIVSGQGGHAIRLAVVNVRDTLIAWYERRGYRDTGEREPYPYDTLPFGTPARGDLSFVIMQKMLSQEGERHASN